MLTMPVMWNIGTTASTTALGGAVAPERRWRRRCASGSNGGGCSPWAGRWCRWCRAAAPCRRRPPSCAGGGMAVRPARRSRPCTAPPSSAGSGWRVSSQSRQAGAGASSPCTSASKASVNCVTIRCASRSSGGSALLALASSARQVAGGDRDLGVRVGDVVLQLLGPVHRVDRHHHGVGAQDREMRDHELRAVLHVQHARGRPLHAQRVQRAGQALGLRGEFAVGDHRGRRRPARPCRDSGAALVARLCHSEVAGTVIEWGRRWGQNL